MSGSAVGSEHGASGRVGTRARSPRTVRKQQAALAWQATQAVENANPSMWSGWFDGSAQPNPGRIGLGLLLRAPSGTLHALSLACDIGDSNVAEYLALIGLLELARQHGVKQLSVYGDTQIVLNDVVAAEPRTIATLHTYRQRARYLLEQFDQVHFGWLPRQRNQTADLLARRARETAIRHYE